MTLPITPNFSGDNPPIYLLSPTVLTNVKTSVTAEEMAAMTEETVAESLISKSTLHKNKKAPRWRCFFYAEIKNYLRLGTSLRPSFNSFNHSMKEPVNQ